MPNTLAFITLIFWPVVSIFFFIRFRPLQAALWTIFGGLLLLPVRTNFDFPLIPPLDKDSLPALSALLACMFIAKKKIFLVPKQGLERWIILAIYTTPILTTLNNSEPVGFVAGLTFHDLISTLIQSFISMIPFLIGLQLVKTYEDQVSVFKWLAIAGLVYSFPALLEVRLSPQLHAWIYGFFPSSFLQQMRAGGFRPVVFLGHGLFVAFFFSVCLCSAVLLWKEKIGILLSDGVNKSKFSIAIIAYLFVILLFCKSASPAIFAITFFFLMSYMPLHMVRYFTICLISIVMLYPTMSIMEIFPHQELAEFFRGYSADRAQSLEFRFYHEGLLLEHAQDKFLFGWGIWGRNRLQGSVTDGYWIIVLGTFGIFGFLEFFGLAFLSILRGLKASHFLHLDAGKKMLVGHALLVSIIMVDQIVNASMGPWVWFLIGALLGRANNVIAGTNYSKI